MKTIKTYTKNLFCCFILLCGTLNSFANHLVGMDLYYTWVSGNTYKITLVAYGNCGSAGLGTAYDALSTNTPAVYIYNGSTYVATVELSIEPPSTGTVITPVCPADSSLTQCTNTAYTIPGVTEFVYSAEYTLSGTSTTWRFLFTGDMTGTGSFLAGRATSITNISSTPDTYIQLVDSLNNTVGSNSCPDLSVIPTPFFCLDNADNYNPGAIPADGDSLTFQLVPGMAGTASSTPSTTTVNYLVPYTATAPLAASTFSFDSYTGQISFLPDALQRSLVVYNIEQRRGGVLVGTSQREMTFLVLTCSTSPASAGFTGAVNSTIDDSTHLHICQNTGSFSVDLNPTEEDTTNDITVTYSGLPAGSGMTVTGNGTNRPHAVFSWTSTGIAPGAYTFFVTYTDNNCPLSGVQTLAYTIDIIQEPSIGYSLNDASTCFARAFVSFTPGGAGSPWKIKVSQSGDTIQTYTGLTTTITDSLAPGVYDITVFSSISNACSHDTEITIPEPTPVVPRLTKTDPSYCGASDGTITVYGLVPGSSDSIKFYLGGVIQPTRVLTVATDSEVIITGLIAGMYSNITATYGKYCVSAPVGPITLVNPAFTMRALTDVNPTYCGICNGSITLYGLRPAETDTINYTIGGISQPPIYRLIPADSEVTLTGLCGGDYSNFVANTAGVCISNTLGPANLTTPAFTMRALTAINPSYCGICDGKITIYGLYPGELDTINYTLGGVSQPPVYATIPADSQVTISDLCVGTYSNFVANTAGVCISNTLGPITLSAPAFTIRSITFTNPSYCGICDGTITIHGVHPGETDSFNYTYNGVAQPPVVFTIPADSMVTFTGLCAGVYADFVASTGGACVSNALGPVTLSPPAFTMRALTAVNPTYCGICNGSITLYGLHPGQTDTFSFTIGGVAAPTVSFLIPADSEVTITDLCAGTYANFVARTGGDCVSNSLGPVPLTVPPFTMRALASTNPVYCGICNGSITLYGLYPGETDTINYTIGGVAQTPIVSVIPADSEVLLTDLCAGTYAGFVANTGGVCISNILGPADLTVPPFTMRALTYTNPTECGFCDGTLTLYGLYPGQTDTFNYTLNGVAQTAFVAVIPADSMVQITGLCEGTYANFVAHTAGVCVSNTLGPVTLVAPPLYAGFNFQVIESCKADTVKFTNTSTPPAGLFYTWNFADGTTDTVTNPNHTYYLPGTYIVTLTATDTKCVDDTTLPVTLNNLLSAGFTSMPDSFLCQGSPVTFTNNSAGVSLSYLWIFGDGGTSTAMNNVYTYMNSGVYTVQMIVTNYVPCSDTVITVLQVDSMSDISFAITDTVLCRGNEATFTATYAQMGNVGLIWGFGDGMSIADQNPVSHTFDLAGVLTVTVEALYRACPDTATERNITVISDPLIDLGPDTSICIGSEPMWLADNINSANRSASWLWNTGATTSKILITAPGTYYVTVKVEGCKSSDSIIITNGCYLDVPNAFTPSVNGVDNYFLARPLLGKGLQTFKMDIYNRWGELIFETTNIDGRGWDGKFNNIAQPQGVYIYQIDATFIDGEKEHHSGNLTLLR